MNAPNVTAPQEPLDMTGQQEPHLLGETGSGFGFRLLVAPGPGRIRHLPPVRFHDGSEWVAAGQPVALIEQGSVTVEVCSPVEGRVAGVLVREGEPVMAGQPLVWLDDAPRPIRPERRP
jgi:biotin carboxyl carrier protein